MLIIDKTYFNLYTIIVEVIDMLFGKRLKKIRLQHDLTQQELGDRIHVTKVSICCYENGNRTPTLDTLLDLCEVFQVGLDELLGQDKLVAVKKNKNRKMYVCNEEVALLKKIRQDEKLYTLLLEDQEAFFKLLKETIK